ncbi:MAG: hypothetical protein EPO52_09100 [Herbiconiux sp.]|uniref:hypothetical protein n=1 Tax=Herbiconiux sp. TaxID=1871186 RepID=UPI001217ACF8|nr:hypothetical protein [Herbiconiux sp.]TAJ48299.1 MAG: hypothetical protein EPO52_09100 [Herbiconiux sp.]
MSDDRQTPQGPNDEQGPPSSPEQPVPPTAPPAPDQPFAQPAPVTPDAPPAPSTPGYPATPSTGQAVPDAQPTAPYPGGQPPYPGAPANGPYPAQPYPAPQYPGQPYPGQPYPGAQPGGPGGPGGPGAPKKKGLSTGAIIGIIGGAVALVIVIIVVIALVVGRIFASAGGGGGTGPAAGGSPSDAVSAYLTALSESDSETALGYLSSPPSDDTLLTDTVLAASNELAPITGIEVLDSTGTSGSADVTASYLLGDTPVTTDFSVTDYDDDGSWEISGGTGYLSTAKFDGLGLTVNGEAVDGDEVEVFPGAYELATTLPNFTLTGETVVLVTDPYTSGDTSDIEPTLTDAALQQFRALVRASAEACLAQKTLDAGCGLAIPATLSDGTQMADGSITRTLTADGSASLDSVEPTLSYDNPTLAQGDYIGGVEISGQCTTSDGATGSCSVLFGPSLGSPSVDMASANPTVLWD